MALKTISTNFLVAQASALVYDAAMATEANIKGLTGLTLPIGFEMSTITVSEMGRRIDLVVPSGGSYTAIDITCNFVPGDPTQQVLQDAALNSTSITTMRFYLKADCDFAALDLINDSGGAYLIGTYSPPSVGSKNELYQNTISILPAGSSILFIAHTAIGGGANIAFLSEATTGAGATATLSAGTWAGFGFEEGDTVIIDWHTALTDPLYVKVETISTVTMTFTEATGDSASITDVTGVAATQMHGATPIEVSGTTTTCS
jgi:hypothetical protein